MPTGVGCPMDTAVALVQAYLRVNGYFTVSEYPVMVREGAHSARALTDLDILAVRFARDDVELDPSLGTDQAGVDMIVGEVKEGRARLNRSADDPRVIEAALVRFGCCPEPLVRPLVREMLSSGSVQLPSGHRLRRVAFGAAPPEQEVPYLVVTLGQVVSYLQAYLRDNWELLRHAESKEPGLGMLMTLEKAMHTEPRRNLVPAPITR